MLVSFFFFVAEAACGRYMFNERMDCFYSRVVFIVFSGYLMYILTDLDNVLAQQTLPETTAPGINATTENFTSSPTENGTTDTLLPTATVLFTSPEAPTLQPVLIEDCLCDLTPDFCDIGCCCDTLDCGVANLSTVFTGCPQKAISGVCIEKWLMFRANVNSSTVTITDSLFCVQPQEKSVPSAETAPQYPVLGNSYYFASPEPITTTYTRDFYRVDDVILTYFSKTSVRGLFYQPSPGVVSALCTNLNPAKFLRSLTLSCTREVTLQSCTTDPTLNAQSYFYDLNMIKHPILETDPLSDILIPVSPPANWSTPRQQNNSCINVVKKVEFVIGYTEKGEISYAKVNIDLANVNPDVLMLQTHSVQFQLTTPSTAGRETAPLVGLKVGSPVIARYEDDMKPLTVIGMSQNGMCSDPSSRTSVLFVINSISGCTFSSTLTNCLELRSQIYSSLQGLTAPDTVAMNSGAQPDWTRVITEECPVSSEESCQSGCTLPHTLSVRVLWARQGLLELPQNYILGVKYVFQCSTFKCPLINPLALSSEVTFVDTTVYPEAPRGAPRPQWRFPFGFFTSATDELDGHVVQNSSGSLKMTWTLIMYTNLLTVILFVF